MDSVTDSSNLPLHLTSFIGREQELADARERLLRHDVRLLTLTGPGGIGKTRLGIQLAQELTGDFVARLAFVSLSPINDPNLVISAIGQALGLREAGSRPIFEQLKVHLRARQYLLVLDNFEQVIEAGTQVAELLGACPALKCLVTSRTPLHISGEHEYPVPPLTLPDPNQLPTIEALVQVEAVNLFIQRATAVKPDFQLTTANAATVAAICQRLEGLPLAVELAASLVKVLPLKAILSRLDHRLHVLVGGPRDLPPRQQTLRNTIAWSYKLLNPEERRLFRCLAVFVGGCTLQAVGSVISKQPSPDTDNWSLVPDHWLLNTITSLVDKNLLKQVASDDSEPRYAMLETIREYGLECLEAGEEPRAIRQAHAAYYLALAAEAETKLKGAEQELWLKRLAIEHANLRSVLRWSLEQKEREIALRLCSALWRFWAMYGYLSEGRRWIAEALALAAWRLQIVDSERVEQSAIGHRPSAISVLAKTLAGAGMLAYHQADLGQSATLCEQSLNLCRQLGDQAGIATALHGLARVATLGGRYSAAHAMYQESLAIYQTLSDRWGMAYTNMYQGVAFFFQDDGVAARRLIEESLATFRALGGSWDIANALFNLSCAHWSFGDYGPARLLAEESLVSMRALGDRRGVARALFTLCNLAFAQDDYGEASLLCKESLTIFRELDDRWFIAQCLIYTAWLTARRQPERAVQLIGAVEALRQAIRSPTPGFDRAKYELNLALLRTRLAETTFQAAWVNGRALTWEQAIEYALDSLDTATVTAQTQPGNQPPPAPTTATMGLTTRELQVLRLVASGLTDAQVAEQLVISPRTVNTHLTSIYNKLGVSSRLAATRYAIEQRVV